jgi:predicted nucleic acid-binding protein
MEDAGDDKFLECAVALKAEAIVSGDRLLLKIENYMGIQAVLHENFRKGLGLLLDKSNIYLAV